MSRLQIALLGGFAVRTEAGDLRVLPTKKSRALLAYLALPAGRLHAREKLTALLWGDSPDVQAQQSFRQALAAVRRGIGNGLPGALVTEGDRIALEPSAVTVDVAEFEGAARHDSVAGFERAAALYRGDLLDGLGVDERPFEEWRLAEGERLRELALEVLAKLLRTQLQANVGEPAIQTALRILGMDPLQESVHRALMRLFVEQGRRSAALRQYQQCAAWLARELSTEPEHETRELYRQILRSSPAVLQSRRAEASGALAPQPAAPSSESPLVGRRPEIAALGAALEQALDAGSRVAIVSGESGIGKTRLIQEFAANPGIEGLQMLFAWCHATEQPLPFRPWIDALRAGGTSLHPNLVGRLSASARVQLARVFPELAAGRHAGVATDEYGPLFDAMRELTELVAGDRPTVIVIEDLHWSDGMSARLLAFLARRLAALLIVGTIRPEETVESVEDSILQQALAELREAGMLHEIALGPLDKAESLTLATSLCRGKRDPAIVERLGADLWKLSEGNPFVIVETLRAVTTPDVHSDRRLLPRTVRESVSGRLARLPEPARRVLEAAAVIGRSFPFRLLPEGTGLDEAVCAAAVDELVRRRVLEAVDERLAFSHDRILQVAYEDLPPRRRALLHRAVALALESTHRDRLDDVADEVGRHFLRAEDVPKALVYLVRFAEIAGERYALDTALGALQQAATAVSTLPSAERDRWSLDLALRRALILTTAGRHGECLQLLRAQAPLQARAGDASLASEYFLRLAMTHAFLGAIAESRAAGEAALLEGERAGRNACIGKALYALAAASYANGAAREAISYDARAIPLLVEPQSRYWLGSVYWNQAANQQLTGDFDAALDSAARCEQIADSMGDCRLQSLVHSVRSRVHVSRGDAAAAVECAERALDSSRDPVASFTAQKELGYARCEAGNVGDAIRTFERMLENRESPPARLTTVWALCGLSEADLRAGEIDGAESAARRALEVNAGLNPFNDALAWRLLGRVALARGQWDASLTHLTGALTAFEQCGAAFEAGRTHVDLARALASRGDRSLVQPHIAAAIQVFDAAGAPRRTAEVRELARALDVSV